MVFMQSFLQIQIYSYKAVILLLIVQAKVSRFPVNPDAFRVLLEKMRLYKQQRMKNQTKQQTLIHNLKKCVSKTDVVIYFITLYLKLGEKYDRHSLCRIFQFIPSVASLVFTVTICLVLCFKI